MKNTILSLFVLIAFSLGFAACSSQDTTQGRWKLVKMERFADNDVIMDAHVYNDDEEIFYEFTEGKCTVTKINKDNNDYYDDEDYYGYDDYEYDEEEDEEYYETIWDGDNVILLDEDGDVQDAFTVLSIFPSSTLQLGNGYTVYTFEEVN
ncbi:MAG: hypothetical protein IIW05_03840 [Paludibacteraceae bacterium]|nr:hypothetical protein [Paludibacteraceae bacterium]MBQ5774984.1 hypothetical protein [Paludibacteraceae bacterium]